jgi:hypothetical protein
MFTIASSISTGDMRVKRIFQEAKGTTGAGLLGR